MARKKLSKKIRFEVFKRDLYQCRYCGRTPPDVKLHVDHLVPVAEGGGNEEDNLVTSCGECNIGKGPRPLSDWLDPRATPEGTADLAERVEQIEAYRSELRRFIRAKHELHEEQVQIVAELFYNEEEVTFPPGDWRTTVARFIERLGVDEVARAASIAESKGLYPQRRFRYFCGVCHGIIRELEP